MASSVRSTRRGVRLLLTVVVLWLLVLAGTAPLAAGGGDTGHDDRHTGDHHRDDDDHDRDDDHHRDDDDHDRDDDHHGDDDDHDRDDDHHGDDDDHDGSGGAGGGVTEVCSGDRVVDLGVRLIARPGDARAAVAVSPPVDPGLWSITTLGADAYEGRSITRQLHEQWIADLVGADGRVLATLGPTSDVPDGVDAASVADTWGPVELAAPVTRVVLRHVLAPEPLGTDSVTAVCLAFTAVPSSTTTTTPPGGGPTTTTTAPGGGSGSTTTAPPGGGSTTSTAPGGGSGSTTTAPGGSTTTLPGGTPAATTSTAPATGGGNGIPPTPPAPRAVVVVVARTGVDCRAGAVSVELANRGGVDANVDLAVSRAGVTTGVVLGAGATTTTTVGVDPALENTRLDIRILDHASGELLARDAVTVDCEAPARPVASVTVDCPAGVVRVRLANEGGEATRLTVVRVRHETVPPTEVAPGAVLELEFPLGDDGEDLLVLDADGAELLRRHLEPDCPRPRFELDAGIDCGAGRALATVTNRGDAPGEVTLVLGATTHVLELDAGVSRTVDTTLTGPEPVAVPVRLVVDGTEVSRLDLEADCVDPSAAVDVGCRALTLTLAERGEGLARFTVVVTVDGAELVRRPVVVEPGADTVDIPLPAGGAWRLRIDEASESAPLAVVEGPAACTEPTASGTVDCATGRARVAVDGGETGVEAALVAGDETVATVSLEPGETGDVEVAAGPRPLEVRDAAGAVLARVEPCPVPPPRTGATAAWALVTVGVALSVVAAWRWRP